MRTLPLHLARQRGFTLAETMIATGILGLVGAAAGYVLINGTVLFAKNTASNLAHDQNRIAVSRLVRDIHSAVSTPQLGRIVKGKVGSHPTAPAGSWTPYGTNVTFWAEPGAGPAAGISFKKMGNSTNPYGGPFNVRNDPGNKDLIQIDSDANAPHEGMDIVFPYYLDTNGRKMEGTIYKVTSNGVNHYNVFVDGGLETRIKKKKDTSVICYYMSRFAYVVENGELKFYGSCMPPPGTTWPITIARNIIEPPLNPVVTVDVSNGSGKNKFGPEAVEIKLNETVKWRWREDSHRVKSSASNPASATFDSTVRNTDATFFWRFKEVGTFAYSDPGYAGMTGTVKVTAWDGSDQSVKPFSQTTPDYVTVNLTTEDNRYSNRNFKAANTLLAGSIPVRSKISDTQ